MKLIEAREITGVLTVLTGLHVGTGGAGFSIGGIDLPVVRTKNGDGLPYIPGSSIRGKMRSLLELRSGLLDGTRGEPLGASALEKGGEVARLLLAVFGTSAHKGYDKDSALGPTRLIVRDALLSSDSPSNVTEVKYENTINRLTGVANPRQIERVVEGTKFEVTFVMRIFSSDDEDKLTGVLIDGLRALELDALGGHGSRGYGQVAFELSGGLQDRLRASRELTTLLQAQAA